MENSDGKKLLQFLNDASVFMYKILRDSQHTDSEAKDEESDSPKTSLQPIDGHGGCKCKNALAEKKSCRECFPVDWNRTVIQEERPKLEPVKKRERVEPGVSTEDEGRVAERQKMLKECEHALNNSTNVISIVHNEDYVDIANMFRAKNAYEDRQSFQQFKGKWAVQPLQPFQSLTKMQVYSWPESEVQPNQWCNASYQPAQLPISTDVRHSKPWSMKESRQTGRGPPPPKQPMIAEPPMKAQKTEDQYDEDSEDDEGKKSASQESATDGGSINIQGDRRGESKANEAESHCLKQDCFNAESLTLFPNNNNNSKKSDAPGVCAENETDSLFDDFEWLLENQPEGVAASKTHSDYFTLEGFRPARSSSASESPESNNSKSSLDESEATKKALPTFLETFLGNTWSMGESITWTSDY